MKTVRSFLLMLTIAMVVSCKHSASTQNNVAQNPTDLGTIREDTSGKQNDSLNAKVKTFQSGTGWGYDIILNGKTYVHQPTMPAVSGNNSFASEADAKTCGDFVAYKIRNHILPPSITPAELDSLKLIHSQP